MLDEYLFYFVYHYIPAISKHSRLVSFFPAFSFRGGISKIFFHKDDNIHKKHSRDYILEIIFLYIGIITKWNLIII